MHEATTVGARCTPMGEFAAAGASCSRLYPACIVANMSLGYTLLGLLERNPRHGYERKRSGDLTDALASDFELFHLEADLRWIELAGDRVERLRIELAEQKG